MARIPVYSSLFNFTSPFHYSGTIRVKKNMIKSNCGAGVSVGCVWVIPRLWTVKVTEIHHVILAFMF